MIHNGIFGTHANASERYVPDYDRLEEMVKACRALGLKIVLTSGSYDIIHEGHMLYLEAAKKLGDVLIVGVDSDEKIRQRKQKGPYDKRPFFSQDVRILQLSFLRPVDIVTLKETTHEKWELIKRVRPDVLQATLGTYEEKDIKKLKEFCGEVIVQPPFATTGTSANLRRMMIGGAQELKDKLMGELPDAFDRVFSELYEDAKTEQPKKVRAIKK